MVRLRGALGDVGRMFGLIQIVEEDPVIDVVTPPVFWRGDDRTLRLTVTDDADARVNLTSATVITLEIKASTGAADPALVSKILGAGVTLLAQGSPDTIGQADIVIAAADTINAATLPEGVYWLDVVVVIGGVRSHVIEPMECAIRDVVNPS
jgi:hypothetical protein